MKINKTNSKAIAVLVVSDNIRKDAIETIKWFNENGVDIIYSINDDNLDLVNNIKRQLEYEGFEPIKTYSQPLLGNNKTISPALPNELCRFLVIEIKVIPKRLQ